MAHTAIPKDELKVFESLQNVKVVFDVGARDDVDYLIIKPDIELHAFEPNPIFFEELKAQIGALKNVHLNKYGLGDVEGEFEYHGNVEAFVGGDAPLLRGAETLPIKTLDWYIKEYDIKQIDFLKIDVEGYDYKVLLGGADAVKICRYIQYESNNGIDKRFSDLMPDFDFGYIGGRNVICIRKGEPNPWIPEVPKEHGLQEKDESNRLHNI